MGWTLAENWWPYQRRSFVTPPFAGYISGHSTFSRAAATVLVRFTGSEFFPRGRGTFEAPKNEFLVFEDGPTETIQLQWATYYDAADETSISRIYGGIHPKADDIPGRLVGDEVGRAACAKAWALFGGRGNGGGSFRWTAMLQWRMITSEQHPSSTPKTPLEREQQLCNDALSSGDFDAITDSEWLALCESEAGKARATARQDTVAEATTQS